VRYISDSRGAALVGLLMMRKMSPRVELVNCPIPALEDDRRQPPGGSVSLATVAARAGFDVKINDFTGGGFRDIVALLPEAEVYGFSTYRMLTPRE